MFVLQCYFIRNLPLRQNVFAPPVVVVVVVNHCFTSLFGTNGLLSDIVIR